MNKATLEQWRAPAAASSLVERVADAIVKEATWAGIVNDRPARAAIRAAVAHTQQHRGHDVWECDADELLAIAAELESKP